ncbi:MAG: HNH endonuclease [Solirubrobacteraceae bacterium]
MAVTDAQRAAVAGRACIVCKAEHRVDPAHLIPRSRGGCGDALCVVALCRTCHRAYDRGELDLLPHLEPASRAQLAHAVGHMGLVGALRRIGGERDARQERDVISEL